MSVNIIRTYSAKFYSANNFDIDVFNQDVRECLNKLKGTELNSEPIIGSFCRKKCIMNDLMINNGFISYEFCFENEKIIHISGMPKMSISKSSIHCRHYYESGVIVVDVTDEEEMKTSVSIINAMGDYIRLNLSGGANLVYNFSRPYECTFNESELMFFLKFIGENVKLKREIHSREDIISLESFIDDDAYLSDMNGKISKGRNKYVVFNGTDCSGNAVKLTIYSNGIIKTTAPIDERTVFQIEKLLSLMKRVETVQYLNPMDVIMDEYMDKIHRNVHTDARQRKKMLIRDELIGYVKKLGAYSEYTDIVDLNILFNIIIYVALNFKSIGDEELSDAGYEEYSAMEDFLYSYAKFTSGSVIDDKKFNSIMKNVEYLVKTNSMSMVRLMNQISLNEKKESLETPGSCKNEN